MTALAEPQAKTDRKAEAIESVRSFCTDRIAKATPDEQVLCVQTLVVVTEYIRNYWHRDAEQFHTQDVECEIVADVVNPATGRPSTVFDHASKMDGIAFDRFSNETVVVEHKSTSETLDSYSPYWRKLVIDGQVSKYLLSLRQTGMHGIRSVLYDVVSKPGTKPKEITKAKVPPIAESGEYCGLTVSDPTIAMVRSEYEKAKGARGGFNGKLRENLELYGLRLRSLIIEEPGAWFARKVITRTDDELLEYSRELWELGAELRQARKANVWPKNSANCTAFGRLCEYFSVCCGEKTVDDDDFTRVNFVHSELTDDPAHPAVNGGRNLLTNSRLVTLQSCKRRHFLRYEMGLRKVSDSASVALYWGSLFHDLMEIVWNYYRGDDQCLTG